MPERFYSEDLSEYGVLISGDKMDNGETRIRVTSGRSSYIRTETKDQTGWQNSHYHSEQRELYLVETGEALFAAVYNEKVVIRKYCSGDVFVVEPMIPHNVKISADGLTHTVKYGGRPDWNAYPGLDAFLKKEAE